MVAYRAMIALLFVMSISASSLSLLTDESPLPSEVYEVRAKVIVNRGCTNGISGVIKYKTELDHCPHNSSRSSDVMPLDRIYLDSLDAVPEMLRYEGFDTSQLWYDYAVPTCVVSTSLLLFSKLLLAGNKNLYSAYLPELLCVGAGITISAVGLMHSMKVCRPPTLNDEQIAEAENALVAQLRLCFEPLKFTQPKTHEEILAALDTTLNCIRQRGKPRQDDVPPGYRVREKINNDVNNYYVYNHANRISNTIRKYMAVGLPLLGVAALGICVQKLCVPMISRYMAL